MSQPSTAALRADRMLSAQLTKYGDLIPGQIAPVIDAALNGERDAARELREAAQAVKDMGVDDTPKIWQRLDRAIAAYDAATKEK